MHRTGNCCWKLFLLLTLLIFVKAENFIENGKNDDVITVCGINATYSDCSCIKNNHLLCGTLSLIPKNITLTNIKILNETFRIKSASFFGSPIAVLKKNKILPENEHLITSIDFSANDMKIIENGSFEKFTSLKTLKISTNYLSNFPEEIWGTYNASSLIELDLPSNRFKNLSLISFTRLTNLVNLYLYNSESIDFTDAIFPMELSNLKVLDLQLSQIKRINDNAFDYLKNLEELDLHANPLKIVPKAIKFLTKLRKLHLQVTDIHTIPKHQFKFNTNLEVLNIHYGILETIEEYAFCGLSNLKVLRLSDNKRLSNIPENAFNCFNSIISPSLEYFSVSNCNLSILSQYLINWKNIEQLEIFGNPFVCNCSMEWLIKEFDPAYIDVVSKLRHKVNSPYDVQCYNPAALRGYTFAEAFGKNISAMPCKTYKINNCITKKNFKHDKKKKPTSDFRTFFSV